ncbi:MAG: flagellar motor switch protein FliN [Phycisphaerales bacterium]|nr:flagellar motor switch protein FliN [Phycisphaerales bacterium]
MSDDAVNPPADDTPEHDSAASAQEEAPQPAAEAEAEGDDAMAAAALAAAAAAVEQLSTEASGAEPAPAAPSASGTDASPLSLPSFETGGGQGDGDGLNLLDDVNLDIRVELGRTVMMVEDVLKLGEGAVVELDKLAGDPVDIYANGRHIAKGEVLVLNDNFCIRVNEIVAVQTEEDDEEASAA